MSSIVKNLDWFKKNMEPLLKGYEINYRYFDKGDFGSLNQAEFNSKKIGGNIDFWELGWLGIFAWNYETNEQLLNILVEPKQQEEKERAFAELLRILQNV